MQGKYILNSCSLKVGEEEFLRQAMLCMRYGAAVVIMAFDELGQAATFEEKVRICQRSYKVCQNATPMLLTSSMPWLKSSALALVSPSVEASAPGQSDSVV